MAEDDPRTVASTCTSFAVLETVGEIDRTTPSEVAAEIGLDRGTVYRHLQTLCELDYVTQNEDGTYGLTVRPLELGTRTRNRLSIYQQGRSVVDELASESGCLTVIETPRPTAVARIYRAIPEDAPDAVDDGVPEGFNRPMHVAAPGLAILAHLSDKRIREVVDAAGLPARTESTITHLNALFEKLDRIRGTGIAVTEGTYLPGIASIAAPVVLDEEAIGAVGVLTTPDDFDRRRDEIESRVRSAGTGVEAGLRQRPGR